MESTELCEKLKLGTYVINVLQDGHLLSSGSGVSINERGDLLTAAHVISQTLPPDQLELQKLTVQARYEGGGFQDYAVICCGISIAIEHLQSPILVDLALLKNNTPAVDRQYFPISQIPPKHGTSILMAGYSDEIDPPFAFNKNLNFAHPDFQGQKELVQGALNLWMRFSMIKSGMVGRTYSFDINNRTLTGYTMYIDNGMHSGASGGPVIDDQGHLVGIITQRAITSFSTRETPGLKVPSGSTIALSPHTVLQFHKNQTKQDFNCYLAERTP
jgi:hypothetical protein